MLKHGSKCRRNYQGCSVVCVVCSNGWKMASERHRPQLECTATLVGKEEPRHRIGFAFVFRVAVEPRKAVTKGISLHGMESQAVSTWEENGEVVEQAKSLGVVPAAEMLPAAIRLEISRLACSTRMTRWWGQN
jgi:hypothetical protein